MFALLCLVAVLLIINLVATGLIVAYLFREIGIKKVLKPSTELADFLDDIKKHGYGVVRLDPDSLLMRSRR